MNRLTVNTSPRLEVRNLSRSFDGRRVVEDVSFSVHGGEVACMLGPSGCGKSTTLRLIAGVDLPDEGHILADGETICRKGYSLSPEHRSIGLMFQDFALFPHLSVSENVAFGLKGGFARNKSRVLNLLERVKMSAHIDSYPHELSGGEQQRIALIRALAPNPRILLMDEPFSGLDERLRDGIRDETLALLKEEGTAVLLVTHEPQEAMRMADQILLMRDGRIVQYGAPSDLYNAPADRQAAAFFSEINILCGYAQGGIARTPFGDFHTPGVEDGSEVEIIIRPQHLKIDFDRAGKGPSPTLENGTAALAHVRRARYLGRESLIEFTTQEGEIPLSATVPGIFLPPRDTPMWLMLRRDKVLVFSKAGTL